MHRSQKQETSEITLDDLGGMITRGFDRLEKRIDGVELRLDNRIDLLGATLNQRIDSMEMKVENGFSSLQNQLDSARLDYTPRREHGLLVERIKKVEKKVGIQRDF